MTVCEDCGAEWSVDKLPPGICVYHFTTRPHRLITWKCKCGAELAAWTDRDGEPEPEPERANSAVKSSD